MPRRVSRPRDPPTEPHTYPYKEKVTVSLSPQVVETLDKHRGWIARSAYVNQILIGTFHIVLKEVVT